MTKKHNKYPATPVGPMINELCKHCPLRWKLGRNPHPKKWPGLWLKWWVGSSIRGESTLKLEYVASYLGDERARIIFKLIQQGATAGRFK